MSCPKCNRDTSINSENELFCKGCGKLIRGCGCSEYPEKVSIVIPCYNGEKYINEAIKNALRQTYENIEVIVVDDGSTDKSLLYLERDPLSKQIVLIEKENGGVGSALNAGINAMKGNWFKWLSADDTLEKDCIERMMNEIKEIKDNKNKIFYTSYDVINSENEIIEIKIEENRNEFSYEKKCAILLNNYYGNATTCMIHKSVFNRVGQFNEKIKNGDDYDFWLRCLFKHNITLHLIPQVLAGYRTHDEQLTNRRGTELFKTIEEIRKKNLELLNPKLRSRVIKIQKNIGNLPMKVKLRRKTRDIIFSIMPNKLNNKLLAKYQERNSNDNA